MRAQQYIRTITAAAMLSISVLGLAQSQAAAQGEEPFAKELAEVKLLSEQGRTNAVVQRLESVAEGVETSDFSAAIKCKVMQEALKSILWSKAGKNDVIRTACAKYAMRTISKTKSQGLANSELIRQQLELALCILPRTTASSDRIAEVSLPLWADLLTEVEHFSIYDPYHPKVKVNLDPLTALANCNEPFNFGQSPDTIKDPVFRKQYTDFLKNRDEFNRKSSEYRHLCDMQEHFFPRLQSILKSAYSGDPEKIKAGSAAIEKYVPDPAMRKELLTAIQSASQSPPSNDSKENGREGDPRK